MHKYLKIANIYLDFTYQYEAYFSDKINEYEIKDINHKFKKMVVDVKENITIPNRKKTLIYKNRYKMATEKDTYIVTEYNSGGIKHLIYHSNNYDYIHITLNKKMDKRLAEFEYVLSGMLFFEIAINENYLPIHASAINYNNSTFLLSGPSQTGKSTQTNYFLKSYKDSLIINEDKPIIFNEDNKWFVSGTPWSGKNVINTNVIKPLNYIFFLNQAKSTEIVSLSSQEKIIKIFRNIHRPNQEESAYEIMNLIKKMIDDLKIYQFNCANSIESAKKLYQFMEEKNEN
ncbi:MAG: hypothetical protein K9L64_06435 [Candidatus Izimaplasma sp.]|nr:hypothetical protein [Candidatus Izimaplasma bacterium]